MVCAEAANVFAVRVWDSVSESPTTCPKSLISPQFIQLFVSSERAEVELESVDVYQCASA